MPRRIVTEPKPYCPDCGGKMALRRPKAHQSWEAFWGCTGFPECKGSRNIEDDGTPEKSLAEEDDEFYGDFQNKYS